MNTLENVVEIEHDMAASIAMMHLRKVATIENMVVALAMATGNRAHVRGASIIEMVRDMVGVVMGAVVSETDQVMMIVATVEAICQMKWEGFLWPVGHSLSFVRKMV